MDKPASVLVMAQTPVISLIKCKRFDYFGGQVIAACIYPVGGCPLQTALVSLNYS